MPAVFNTREGCGGFSDSEFAFLQRAFAGFFPEPPPPPRKRTPRVLIIIDGDRVRARMRRLGLSAEDLTERTRIWGIASIIDFGELAPHKAARLAKVLGVPLDEIAMGTRRTA